MRRMLIVLAVMAMVLATAAPASAARKPPKPANDELGSATPVTLGQSIDFSSVGATSNASDPGSCNGSGPTPGPFTETIWYSYAAPDARTVFADASTFDYLAVIFVLADTGSGLQVIDCSAFPATVTFSTTPGVTYDVMIGSLPDTPGGGTGVFTLGEPLILSVSVDPNASVNRDGVATVTGTISCSVPADFAEVDVSLSEPIGRFIIRGFGFASPACDATPATWSADVVGGNGTYGSGRATADVTAFACTGPSCDFDSVSASVRLRR
jgi:hypothetical protein